MEAARHDAADVAQLDDSALVATAPASLASAGAVGASDSEISSYRPGSSISETTAPGAELADSSFSARNPASSRSGTDAATGTALPSEGRNG